MSTPLEIAALWNALKPDERRDACLCLLQAADPLSKHAAPLVIQTLAKEMSFRLKFFDKRTPEYILERLYPRFDRKPFNRFWDDALCSWLLARRGAMIAAFLDAAEIPHKDCLIEDSAPIPSADVICSAFQKVADRYSKRDWALYFGFLVVRQTDYWCHLPRFLTTVGIDWTADLSAPLQESAAVVPAIQPPPEPTPPLPESSDAFTTLDNWLIQTAVATALEETGSLHADQVEDLVEEVVQNNANRLHSLFHRGFIHALFDKDLCFHFPGENAERRAWYLTGAIMGLIRERKDESILALLRQEPEIVQTIVENEAIRCGAILLPALYPLLWKTEKFDLLEQLMVNHIHRLPEKRQIAVLHLLYEDCATLLRTGRWASAPPFLHIIQRHLEDSPEFPPEVVRRLLIQTHRKQAQALQMRGDFAGASKLLRHLLDGGEDDVASVRADLALVGAGYRSLAEVLPTPFEAASRPVVEALRQQTTLLREAVENDPERATNAHFLLGLVHLLEAKDAGTAANALKAAHAGMMQREKAYQAYGLFDWSRLLLGLALLETAEGHEFQQARTLILQSIESPVHFPLWLWSRVLHAAAVFDDTTLASEVGAYLLDHRGEEAQRILWSSGISLKVPSLRLSYLEWLDRSPVDNQTKWEQLRELLKGALAGRWGNEAENVLDRLECLAMENRAYRRPMIELLKDESNFSPHWSSQDAENALIRLYELEGDLPAAAGLLVGRFYQLRQEGQLAALTEAANILDELRVVNHDTNLIEELKQLLERTVESEGQTMAPDSGRTRTLRAKVLFVGGNETQQSYVAALQREWGSTSPDLKVEFYIPCWNNNWGSDLEKVRGKLPLVDVVVIHNMIRTQFGRQLRAECNRSKPWFPCTGKGKASLKRSIEAAAQWLTRSSFINTVRQSGDKPDGRRPGRR